MKFAIQRNELLSVLNVTGKAITKSIIPILDNYRFQIEGSNCLVTGSNIDVFISKSIDVSGNNELIDICIQKEKLLNLVKSLADQPLFFEIKEDKKNVNDLWLTVKWASGNCKLPIVSGEDYVKIPVIESHAIEVDGPTLTEVIDKVLFTIDPNTPAAPAFKYALLDFGNGINIVGCDIMQLSIQQAHENTINLHQSLIPKSSLEVLKSISTKGSIDISYSDKNISFLIKDEGIHFTCQVIDDKYVDYLKVMKNPCDKFLEVSTSELSAALKRVNIFSMGNVILDFKDGDFTLIAENTDFNESVIEQVKGEYNGEDFKIMLRCSNLIDMLSKIKSEYSYLSFSQVNMPVYIRPEKTESMTNVFVAMPLIQQS